LSRTPDNPLALPNLQALQEHLPDGSLAAELVAAVAGAPTEEDADRRLAAVLDDKLKAARAELDAKTPVA